MVVVELLIVIRGGNFYLNLLIHPWVMTMKVMEKILLLIYIYIYIYIVGGPLILGRNRGGFGPLWGYLRAVRLLGHDWGVYGPNELIENARRGESNRDLSQPEEGERNATTTRRFKPRQVALARDEEKGTRGVMKKSPITSALNALH